MGIIIGIDVGGSTTKIVGIKADEMFPPLFIKASDPVSSLFGAFGRYLFENKIALSDIEHIVLTGVGAAFINEPLYGVPTTKTDEFVANALGARFRMKLDKLIVVSMGTGTSYIRVEGNDFQHVGGMGIGGGTLQGLSRLLLNNDNVIQVAELALKGKAQNVNLNIGDICKSELPNLPLFATASSFGKVRGNEQPEDLACGLITMVFESIGQGAYFTSLNSGIKDFVLIGNLTRLPQCKKVFANMEKIYKVNYIIPSYAEYRTALGAALSYGMNK